MKDKDARRWIETLQKDMSALRGGVEGLRSFRGAQDSYNRDVEEAYDRLLDYLGLEEVSEPEKTFLRKKKK